MGRFRVMIVLAAVLTTVIVGMIVPGEGFSASYTLTPTNDALVYNQSPDTNYGGSDSLSVFRRMSYDQRQRSFLKFDLSGIAAGETIVGAALHVYAYGYHTFGPLDTALYYVGTDSWTEGAITWNNQPGYGNQLDLKMAASWNYVYPNNNPQWGVWNLFAVPGAWGPTADLSDGSLSLLLKLPVAIETGNYNRSGEQFYSKEATGLQPYLLVETQAAAVPLPPSLLLFGSGLLSSILFARRRFGK